MRKKVKFENGMREIQINQDAGFKKLNLISAIIKKVKDMKVIPSVELILSNNNAMFTSYCNLVPGTNNLNCFDLLLTATNNSALSNQTFHTLKCLLPDNVYDTDLVIDIEFEVDN